MKNLRFLFALVFITITINIKSQSFTYDFINGYEGWTGDFADYPLTDSLFYQLKFTRATLPAPLNTGKYALMITGCNHSDDLFMFIKRKITGLKPNTTYQLLMDVEFASKAPTHASGVGGAPGESVTVKAGASIIEPLKIHSGGYFRMNIDIGAQANSGVAMKAIGNVGVSDSTSVFTLVNRNNRANPFLITTDANAEVWVCIGTDSGYESTTTLYYNLIKLTFSTVSGLQDPNRLSEISVYPNPSTNQFKVKINQDLVGQSYIIGDEVGRQILTGKLTSEISNIDMNRFPIGTYFLEIGKQGKQRIKVIKN